MRYLIALLFCVGLCLAGGYRRERKASGNRLGPNDATKDYIASIVQVPTVYHRCNAFFVTKYVLVAPASCLLCDEICEFQIAISTQHSVFSPRHLYEIENITIHDKYLLQGNNDNPSYNIAVFKIAETNLNVQPLTIAPAPGSKEGYLSSWVFNNDMTDFHLRTHIFEKITHYICEENGVNVRLDEICVKVSSPVELGRFNEGAVFVIDGDTSSSPSTPMGFYGKSNDFSGPSQYYSFVSVPYYSEWLIKAVQNLTVYT